MAFCAICTDELPRGHQRFAPLGRGNAMVNVCDACFDEKPIATSDDRGAYVPPPVGVLRGNIRRDVHEGQARVIPNRERYAKDDQGIANAPGHRQLTPGYELIRIPRIDRDGNRRDHRDPLAALHSMQRHGARR